eukprot:1195500-Prorocentrum_minimum.AAC.8
MQRCRRIGRIFGIVESNARYFGRIRQVIEANQDEWVPVRRARSAAAAHIGWSADGAGRRSHAQWPGRMQDWSTPPGRSQCAPGTNSAASKSPQRSLLKQTKQQSASPGQTYWEGKRQHSNTHLLTQAWIPKSFWGRQELPKHS